MKTQPRPYKAGYELGKALAEVGNILYLMDNRRQFLEGLYNSINEELRTLDQVARDEREGR